MAAVIKIEISTSGGLDQVKKDVADVGKTAEKSGGGFSAMQEIATGALRRIGEAAVNLAGEAFSKLGDVIGDSISAARESNQVAAQTAQVIKSTGEAAGVTTQHVLDYASSLSAAAGQSLFGDEQIAQSTNLLLTFTNIRGATLDAATAISVDMAQALGGAPKDAAIQLGKALNDPVKGITALTRVGVTFSDEQKAMIKAMTEAGDTAGAQKVILDELNKEFGGSAKAAAEADGGFAQFQDRLGEMEETIGKAILPVLGQLMGVLNDTLLPIVEDLANTIGGQLNTAFSVFNDIWASASDATSSWAEQIGFVLDALLGLQNGGMGPFQIALDQLNEIWLSASDATSSWGEQIGFVLDAILGLQGNGIGPLQTAGDALSNMFGTVLVPAFDAVWNVLQTQVMPILSDLATALFPLVGAAIQILAGFWTDVLVPAVKMLWEILTTVVLPVIAALAGWLRDNLPGAIQAVADFLTNTLFPALHGVYDFLSANVIPILALVAQWLITNVPIAIQAASDFFNNILVPALSAVWAFIQNNVLPIFDIVAQWLSTTIPAATQTTSNFWTGTLQPALNAVWTFLNTYVIPLITALVQVHLAILNLTVRLVASIWTDVLLPALRGVWTFIQTNLGPVITWLHINVWTPLFNTLKDTGFFIIGALQPWFENLSKIISGAVSGAFQHLSNVAGDVKGALHSIGDAVQSVISWLSDLASKLNSISIPDWLQGHSPPPLADWFSYISDSVAAVNAQLPTLHMNLAAQMGPAGQSTITSTNSRSFTYAPTINASGGVSAPMDLALASSLAGV